MTECIRSSFLFDGCGNREIVARFDGGTISTDGGGPFVAPEGPASELLTRLAQCSLDQRDQSRVEHTILEMLSERVYGLALGYEDINDHEELRRDPLFGILAGREEPAPPAEIVLDMDTTDLPLHGKQEGRFFHGYYDSYAIFRSMSSAETMYCARVCANPVTMQRTVV